MEENVPGNESSSGGRSGSSNSGNGSCGGSNGGTSVSLKRSSSLKLKFIRLPLWNTSSSSSFNVVSGK